MALLPEANPEASRNFTYAQHSEDPHVGGGNGSLKNPYNNALRYLDRTAKKTTKECNGMLRNLEWYARRQAAQAFVNGVDLLGKAPGAALKLTTRGILVPIAVTTVGRMTTGQWPTVQKTFDYANAASWALAVYKKCDSLQPAQPTGTVAALSMVGNELLQRFPLIQESALSQALINSSVGQKIPGAMKSLYTKFDSQRYGRTTMFMAASWVGSHLLQKTPLIKHIANHPLANNILWGIRLGSTAYLASPFVATIRAWNANIIKQRLAANAEPKKASKATAPTPLTQAELDKNLLDFQDKVNELEIIDKDKRCLPAGAVQALAGIGLERSQHTQPSKKPLLEEIRKLSEQYTEQLGQKAEIAQNKFYEACDFEKSLAPQPGVNLTPTEQENHSAAMNAKRSAAIAWDAAEIAVTSNNTLLLSSENKDRFCADINVINSCMLRSKIYSRFAELLYDDSRDFRQEMPLFSREFLNHPDLMKNTLLSITAQGLDGHAPGLMELRIDNLIAGRHSDPISFAERCEWLEKGYGKSDDNLKLSQKVWDRISAATNGSPLPPVAALPINQRLAQENAALAKAEKALAARTAKDSTLLERIDPQDPRDSQRVDTADSYPAVFVNIDENDQVLLGQSLSGSRGTWASRNIMRGEEIESRVAEELADTADGEAIRYQDEGSEELLFARLSLRRFVKDVGGLNLNEIHSCEELIALIDEYSEKLVYRRPTDQYGVGKNSDHELTAAVLLSGGLKVQSDLIKQFTAGTLFQTETLEYIENMIGFLDFCQNHRVTRLTAEDSNGRKFVPSFLEDEAYQNHWAGFSIIRDRIVTQLADQYAIEQTQEMVKAKFRNGEFVEPRAGIATGQEIALLRAVERLDKLVNRPVSPVNCKTNGTTMLRNAFRKDFTDLKTAVIKVLGKYNSGGQKLFAACQEEIIDTRRAKLPNGSHRNIPVLEMLYEASGSMMYALKNPNVAPIVEATLQGITSEELQIELNECFGQINKAYKDYGRYAGYNEDILAASDHYRFAIRSGKQADIKARQYYGDNYFESPKIPSAISHAWNQVTSKLSSGTQVAQARVRTGAGMVAGGGTAIATVAYTGASAMFGAGLRIASTLGYGPVETDDDLPPPYAPSLDYVSLPSSSPSAPVVKSPVVKKLAPTKPPALVIPGSPSSSPGEKGKEKRAPSLDALATLKLVPEHPSPVRIAPPSSPRDFNQLVAEDFAQVLLSPPKPVGRSLQGSTPSVSKGFRGYFS